MTNEITDIRDELRGEDARLEAQLLEGFTCAAILDPDAEVRKLAIEQLTKRYEGNIVGGFSGDNQLFLKGKGGRIFYVCDKPGIYVEFPSQAYNFDIE